MSAAVVLSAVRTPVGTAFKGTLRNTPAEYLGRVVLEESIKRSGLKPEQIGDVIFAESLYGGGAVARHAAVEAGLINAGGMALNRHCAGSLTSVGLAAANIMAGMEDAMVAGGVQSTSLTPVQTWRNPVTGEMYKGMPPTHPDSPEAPNADMSITVGWNTAKKCGLTREQMDAWAVRSHERAIAAIDNGQFKDELVAVKGHDADGNVVDFTTDEHPRRGSTIEKLATLKPLHPEIEGFSITAGNSSGMNDAASALVLASEDFAKANGREALATVLAWGAAGVNPAITGLGVLDVVKKVLGRAGVSVSDIALWEINEAFASVPVAVCKEMGISEDIVNTAGSGCSIGHPVGASGGRMLATLIHDLRRRGGGLGVATMCAGGGQAGAVLVRV